MSKKKNPTPTYLLHIFCKNHTPESLRYSNPLMQAEAFLKGTQNHLSNALNSNTSLGKWGLQRD